MNAKTLLWVLTVTLLTAAVAVGAKFAARSTSSETTITTRTAITPQGNDRVADEAPSDIRVVLFALRGQGFEPTEMQLPAGEYLFVVQNRTGLDEVTTRLVRENGEHLGQSKAVARQKDWKQRLRLNPGTYLLSEISHPDWTCRIVVER